MNLLQAGFLGIVQGVTEFLPVSSSGHLVILQSLIPDFSQPGILFDVFLHFGTILAVLVFFYKKILKLNPGEIRVLIIATIPAVIVGYLLKDTIDVIFKNTKLVGLSLIITGFMNFKTDMNKEITDIIDDKKSLLIGLFQAFAILPGISRSGSTIFAGTLLGVKKEKAAEFSFLLSVPAVMGANLLEIIKNRNGLFMSWEYIVGILCSFVVGILCINILLKTLVAKKLKYLGVYCILLGVITLLFV